MSNLGVGISSRSNMPQSLSTGLRNVNTSIRSLAHSVRSQLNQLQQNLHTSPSSTILNNDAEQSPPGAPMTNGQANSMTSVTTTTPPSSNRNHRRGHRRSRDRYRNPYSLHSGLVTIETLDKDRNVLAAILSIVVIAILATALAQPKWFSIYNDLCIEPKTFDKDSDVRLLEYPTKYHSMYSHSSIITPITVYGLTPDVKGCATAQIIALKRTIIGLCFLAITCNLIQFFMDTMGTKRKWVNSMRVHAIGNITSVLLCVLIIGLCYFVSILYERVQIHQLFRKFRQSGGGAGIYKPTTTFIKQSPVFSNQFDFSVYQIEVKFELSYYLVTLAGFLSIMASAANLFRRPRQIFMERIADFNCRGGSHHHARTTNGDENSLLNADVLNHETSASYLPYYSPNGWFLNPNWNLFYNSVGNSRRPNVATNPLGPQCPPPPYSP